jgi:plastocyanin
VNGLELQEPMTRRRVLLLGVGAAMTTILAACGTSGGGTETTGGAASIPASEPGTGGATSTTIRMVDGNAFDPVHLTVRVGDRVTWENASSSIHTATCDPDNPLGVEHLLPDGADTFNSGNVNPDDTFEHTFDVAGDYSYSCMLHRPMVGHLTVQA